MLEAGNTTDTGMRKTIDGDESPLRALGVDAVEEQVYRHLIRHPGALARDIAGQLGLSPRRVLRLLDGIERKGLARHSPEQPRRYHAAAPDMAIEALVLKQQEDLQRARVLAQELQEAALAMRGGGTPEHMVELVATSTGERLVFEQLYLGARHELVTLMRPPMRVSRMQPPFDLGLQMQAHERGVRFRTLVDDAFLDLAGGLSYLSAEMEAGVEARRVAHLPFKLVMADRRTAIIPLRLEQSDNHILVVRSSALLDALYALFEILWQRGSPVTRSLAGTLEIEADAPACETVSDGSNLLALMALGLNDKSVAHELGISARTLERRMAELMRELGARTRFQAGYLAGLRAGR